MKKIGFILAAMVLSMGLCFSAVSCSGETEKKGRIEAMTEKAGKDAAKKITAPIDKAKAVKEQQEERDREAAGKVPAE